MAGVSVTKKNPENTNQILFTTVPCVQFVRRVAAEFEEPCLTRQSLCCDDDNQIDSTKNTNVFSACCRVRYRVLTNLKRHGRRVHSRAHVDHLQTAHMSTRGIVT